MDEFDEEFVSNPYYERTTPLDEGSIKALTIDEIKNMKPQKPSSYNSFAFKKSLQT